MAGYRIRSDWLTCPLSEGPDVMAQLEKAILLSFLLGRCHPAGWHGWGKHVCRTVVTYSSLWW